METHYNVTAHFALYGGRGPFYDAETPGIPRSLRGLKLLKLRPEHSLARLSSLGLLPVPNADLMSCECLAFWDGLYV